MKPIPLQERERASTEGDCEGPDSHLLWEDNTSSDLPAGVILRVRGRAGTADVVNANGRLYPAAVYRKVVRRFNQAGSEHSLLGELDHPETGSRLGKTALRITRLHLAGGRHLNFEAHVLDTPPGQVLKSLLHAGVPVNVSTRGVGSLKVGTGEAQHDVVCPDYELHGIDAVARAAHAGAMIHAYQEGVPSAVTSGVPAAGVVGSHDEGQEGEAAGSPSGDAIRHRESEEPMPLLTEGLPFRHPPAPEDPEAPLPGSGDGWQEVRPPLEDDAGDRIAELEVDLITTREALEVVQAVGARERERLEQERDNARAELLESRRQIEDLEAELSRAQHALDEQAVGQEVNRLLNGLTPDLRRTVEDQLAGCGSRAEVTERWNSIEAVLSAAGLIYQVPAGAGRVDHSDRANYSPTQQLQRRLLGVG